MPTTDSVDVSETATASTREGGSRSRNITINRKRLSQSDVRKSPSKITVPLGARAAVRAFWDLNRQLCGADVHPDDPWRAAAQRAAQQLRAWGNGVASPAIPAQVPALASFGEVAEKGLEERKVIALETIAEALAEAVKFWILTQRDEEEEEDEDEDEDEEEENEDN
ncbi:hypothetical protein E5D57_004442 [Metarhizium anisopliae]|nr:hypothetical protein E5D57_004442 [Metarhizium anisopliae]